MKIYTSELSRLPCDPDLAERLRTASRISGIPQSEIRRRALRRYLMREHAQDTAGETTKED